MNTCRVSACVRTDLYETYELCRLHYQRWRKTGDPLGRLDAPVSAAVRFWAKVEKTETCWLWIAATDKAGYGRFQAGGSRADVKNVLAHRFAYEATVGPVPPGAVLDHLCRVRRCVRPEHLEPVDQAENVWRGDWGAHVRALRAKTHCVNRHPLSGNNLIITARGHRRCRACKNAGEARRYRRKRARLLDGEQASTQPVVSP